MSDPSELAAEAAGGNVPEPEPTPDASSSSEKSDSQDSGSSSSGRDYRSKLTGALLETEPDETPEDDYPNLPEYTAHAVIGVKKVLNHLTGGELKEGTPAIENFTRAGIGFSLADATGAE